jgi:hypothetical protein
VRKLWLLCTALVLFGAVPQHVQTSDYWGGYAGTHAVPPQNAARWLTWAEVDAQDARRIAPFGVKTMLYTNPNRLVPGAPLYGPERYFAHDCGGGRISTANRADEYMMDITSPGLLDAWRNLVREHVRAAPFTAIFVDDAVGAFYASGEPCGYSEDAWIREMIEAERFVGFPVVYNALSHYNGHGVSKEIALNAAAIGGMMEECYSQLEPNPRATGWRWYADEQTELDMARDGKFFFCYGRDLMPADQAYESRLYTYASFLLTYDISTSVLWEYYQTPTHAHVMPESQLVALDPVRSIRSVTQLRERGGLYVRQYGKCYIAGRFEGACVAAVNPDADSHPFALTGYTRSLVLHGSGVFDGGTVTADGPPPLRDVPPQTAVIAFK